MTEVIIFTIGNLAVRASTSVDTIRFYERVGIMKCAQRTQAGYRLYSPDALHRLAFIKHAQRCGLKLAEVRALLEAADMDGGDAQLDAACTLARAKRDSIAETIAALSAMSDALSCFLAWRAKLQQTMAYEECPLMETFAAAITKHRQPAASGGEDSWRAGGIPARPQPGADG